MRTPRSGGRLGLLLLALLLPIMLSACGSGSSSGDAGPGEAGSDSSTSGETPELAAASRGEGAPGEVENDTLVVDGVQNPFDVPDAGAALPPAEPPIPPVAEAEVELSPGGIPYCD